MSTQDIISGHYAGPHSNLSDEELLSELEHITAIRDGFSETLGRLEQEAFRRMEERGAKAIPSINYICEIQNKSDYDQLAFTPLKEIFNSDDLKRCLSPAHTKEIEVPERWATTTVKAVAAKYGDRAKAIVENARTETRGRLKFSRRDR